MFNPKKLSKIFAYITLFFTLFLIFSTNVNADVIENPEAYYSTQIYAGSTGYLYKPNVDLNLTFIKINESNPNYNTLQVWENGTNNKYFENTTIISANNYWVKIGIILNASTTYAFVIFQNGCVGRTNHYAPNSFPLIRNYGNITGGISSGTCGVPDSTSLSYGFSFTYWNVTPVYIPKTINITEFNILEITENSISYNWNWSGNFVWNELYLNDILFFNSTNSTIKNFIALGLNDNTEYIGKLIVYYNSTLFDNETITNTTILHIQTSEESFQKIAKQTEEIKKGFNLFAFLIIFIITLFVPLISKAVFKDQAEVIVITAFLIDVVLLFYIHSIETGITTLLKWVISLVIFASMFILNEEILIE